MKKTENILQWGTPRKIKIQIDPFGAFWCILFNYKNGLRRPKKRKSVKKLKTLMPELLTKPSQFSEFSGMANYTNFKNEHTYRWTDKPTNKQEKFWLVANKWCRIHKCQHWKLWQVTNHQTNIQQNLRPHSFWIAVCSCLLLILEYKHLTVTIPHISLMQILITMATITWQCKEPGHQQPQGINLPSYHEIYQPQH